MLLWNHVLCALLRSVSTESKLYITVAVTIALVVQEEYCQYILSTTEGFLYNISISNIADDCSPGVDPPYAVHGGIFREEAIMLLRRFYVQQNDKGELEKPKSDIKV